MAKAETIVTLEMDETRTCSRSLEKQIFDRNILVLLIFFALFILWMILVCSFDFAFHQKLMCVFYRLASYWELFASQGLYLNLTPLRRKTSSYSREDISPRRLGNPCDSPRSDHVLFCCQLKLSIIFFLQQ